MKFLLNEKGKVSNCSTNISKMRWYEYGRYIGISQIRFWYKEYLSELIRLCKEVSMLIIATLLIPFTPFIYPFVWSHRIRKAKEEVAE